MSCNKIKNVYPLNITNKLELNMDEIHNTDQYVTQITEVKPSVQGNMLCDT